MGGCPGPMMGMGGMGKGGMMGQGQMGGQMMGGKQGGKGMPNMPMNPQMMGMGGMGKGMPGMNMPGAMGKGGMPMPMPMGMGAMNPMGMMRPPMPQMPMMRPGLISRFTWPHGTWARNAQPVWRSSEPSFRRLKSGPSAGVPSCLLPIVVLSCFWKCGGRTGEWHYKPVKRSHSTGASYALDSRKPAYLTHLRI